MKQMPEMQKDLSPAPFTLMASVDVLVVGYVRECASGWEGNATATLIDDGRRRILVDPGLDAGALTEALGRRHLRASEITDVFLTHYHLDHLLNAGLFPRSRLVDGHYVVRGTRGIAHEGKPFGGDVRLLPTPGHAPEHTSLMVSTSEGLVAVAGDVIWYPADSLEEALTLPDPHAHQVGQLKEDRKAIWTQADIIIPGHGPAFSP